MFIIALKNLSQEKGRLLLSILSITFAVTLMILTLGIYFGLTNQYIRYSTENTGDIVIMQKGIRDLHHGYSLIDLGLIKQIRNYDGVKEIIGNIQFRSYIEKDGKPINLTLTSYDPKISIGAPWTFIDGTQITNSNDIVVGEDFLKKSELKLNDSVSINNETFKIVGTIKESSNISSYYVFISLSKSQELLNVPNSVNFIYIQSEPAKVTDLITKINNNFADVKAVTKDDFVEMNRQEIEVTFLPIIYVIVLICFLVGSAVIGLTLFTATIEKSKEYGIFKAIGGTNYQLFKLVLIQSLASTILGLIIGIISSLILKDILKVLMPNMDLTINFKIVILISSLTLIMSLLSIFVPIKKIGSISPMDVFKS